MRIKKEQALRDLLRELGEEKKGLLTEKEVVEKKIDEKEREILFTRRMLE